MIFSLFLCFLMICFLILLMIFMIFCIWLVQVFIFFIYSCLYDFFNEFLYGFHGFLCLCFWKVFIMLSNDFLWFLCFYCFLNDFNVFLNVVFYVFQWFFMVCLYVLNVFHDCLQFSYGNMIIECLCFSICWLVIFNFMTRLDSRTLESRRI